MKTELIFILDASGSMRVLTEATLAGFNGLIAEQRTVPGECRVTLVLFNHSWLNVFRAVRLADVDKLTQRDYFAEGNTALLDALGFTLEREGMRIAEEKWADKVVVVVTTDGEENASITFTIERVRAMVEHAQQHGWEFVFLGANIDTFAVGKSLGIPAVNTVNFAATEAGVRHSYSSASATLSTTRGGRP